MESGNAWQDVQTEDEDSAAPSAPVKKAAAAMAVGVGSFQDPDQLQVWNAVSAYDRQSNPVRLMDPPRELSYQMRPPCPIPLDLSNMGSELNRHPFVVRAGSQPLLGAHAVHGQQKVSRRE